MAVAVSHSSASSKLSSSLHSVKDSLFHQAKFAFTHQPFSTSNTLESEAYRGELSLLRQKSNQLVKPALLEGSATTVECKI